MRHGSLFSGIGGFDLAAEWMGWENVFHCEWNPFGQKVLKHYWPNAESFEDITKTDFTKYANKIDILTGGFPCQPYSMAGKRKGKEDERHLWPEMLRAIREIKPKYIVGENVFGLLNWNGGMVFDEVHSDLEAEGYEVQAVVIPAAAVNAPHGRDRVWFVAKDTRSDGRIQREPEQEAAEIRKQWDTGAGSSDGVYLSKRNATDSNGIGRRGRYKQPESNQSKEWQICPNKQQHRDGVWCKIEGCSWNATNPNGNGFDQRNGNNAINTSEGGQYTLGDIEQVAMHTHGTMRKGQYIGQKGEGKFNRSNSRNGINNFQNFPTQSPICGGDDGLPTKLDGITFSKWRAESIKGYGNAICPQVAYQIFKALELCK